MFVDKVYRCKITFAYFLYRFENLMKVPLIQELTQESAPFLHNLRLLIVQNLDTFVKFLKFNPIRPTTKCPLLLFSSILPKYTENSIEFNFYFTLTVENFLHMSANTYGSMVMHF